MPYWRLFYHLIWATKDRQPFLASDKWPELERYLVLTARSNQLIVHGVGGIEDHVHLAISIPPAMSVSDAVGRLKGNSSRLMRQQFGNEFSWQAEYGVVSFAERHLPSVLAYITNQRRHHANNTLWKTLEELPE